MNKIILLLLLLALNYTGICQGTTSEEISAGIAKKMQDSLNLTIIQKNRILEVNRFLASQKQIAFNEITNRDSLRLHLQKVENMRDSLYKDALPDEKYLLYIEKKSNLILAGK